MLYHTLPPSASESFLIVFDAWLIYALLLSNAKTSCNILICLPSTCTGINIAWLPLCLLLYCSRFLSWQYINSHYTKVYDLHLQHTKLHLSISLSLCTKCKDHCSTMAKDRNKDIMTVSVSYFVVTLFSIIKVLACLLIMS